MFCVVFYFIFVLTIKKQKIMKLKTTKNLYLTKEEFDKDLEICLVIINEPSKQRPYYVCEYTSAALYKSIVKVYIIK